MKTAEHLAALPPFRPGHRSSGVLMHMTSLPSPYGIGDVGPAAFAWVDRLHDAGQRWWQALPLGPAGRGNSPYSALSSFAGNSLLVMTPITTRSPSMKTETVFKSLADFSLELVKPEPGRTAQASPKPTAASVQQPPENQSRIMLPEHSCCAGYLHWGLNE